jgi:hypothetical protein
MISTAMATERHPQLPPASFLLPPIVVDILTGTAF